MPQRLVPVTGVSLSGLGAIHPRVLSRSWWGTDVTLINETFGEDYRSISEESLLIHKKRTLEKTVSSSSLGSCLSLGIVAVIKSSYQP